VQIWIDPAYPDAHRDPALRTWLERRALPGLVRYDDNRALVIAPPSVGEDGKWHERASNRNLEEPHSVVDGARADAMTMAAAAKIAYTESMKPPPLDFSPMSPAEYVAAVAALGLSVSHSDKTKEPESSAAHVFGLSPRLSRYYAKGGYPVPLALAAFLRLLVAARYTGEQIAKARR
jgi:hypothetical protein